MKNIFFFVTLIFLASNIFGQKFVSPIGFNSTEENKAKVVAFIKKQVKEDYAKIGMDDPMTLRMMEKENLDAFKKLTKATNTVLLRKVMKTYCDIGMCNYSTIWMMYQEQNKASQQELKW